jgi:hypothetical protein
MSRIGKMTIAKRKYHASTRWEIILGAMAKNTPIEARSQAN